MRRTLTATTILTLVLAAAPSASSALEKCPVQGGTIRAAMAGPPPTLDWISSFAAQTRDLGVYLYESLVTIDDNYDVAPQLASSWTASPDGRTYTFHLRKGVKFHDGSPMTSADVAASFDRFLAVSPRKADLKMVKSTRAVDSHTFEVTLSEPSAAFVPLMAYPGPAVAVMPKKVIDGVAAGKLPTSGVIGTGPYRLAEWTPDKHVHLQRFADYSPSPGEPSGYAGRRLACVEHIYFVPVPEVSSRAAGLESGSYDYVQNLQAEAYKRLNAMPGMQAVIIKPYYLVAMHLNTQNGPLKEWKLRRAIQVGLNQEEVMLTSAGDPALFRLDPSIFFKEQFWHSAIGANRYNERNVAQARQLIKESGYDGSPIRINTASNFQWLYLAALTTESQLRQLGLNTKLQSYDYPTMIDIFRKKRDAWDISYNGFSIRTDPGGFTFVFHSSSGYQPYASKDVDSLLDRALVEPDRTARAKLYEQFQDVVYKDIPVIKQGDLFGFDALRDRVQNFRAYYTTPRFWNTWVKDGK
ncbi:MAG: ABC transporter substrate-binding protein [Candidatus Rokuibacteriota bacterium]